MLKKYDVRYTLLGGGTMTVEAPSEEAARELAYYISHGWLMRNTDFKRGFDVDVDDVQELEVDDIRFATGRLNIDLRWGDDNRPS